MDGLRSIGNGIVSNFFIISSIFFILLSLGWVFVSVTCHYYSFPSFELREMVWLEKVGMALL